MVGFVTSTASSLLSFEASLETNLLVGGGMVPTDERVTILVARTPFCGSTLMATMISFMKYPIYYKKKLSKSYS